MKYMSFKNKCKTLAVTAVASVPFYVPRAFADFNASQLDTATEVLLAIIPIIVIVGVAIGIKKITSRTF